MIIMSQALQDNSGVKIDPVCFNHQMLRSSHYILKAYDDAYRPFGVRATQMPVLGAVSRLQPVTIKQVADEMESERSVMSRKLQVMEKKGWIKQKTAPGKEKCFLVTAKGRRLIDRIKPARLAVQNRFLSAFDADEQHFIFSLCNKLKSIS